MFILDGNPLPLDTPFTHGGISYPANWLRLSTAAEKQAIGITEVPDSPSYDTRFYWGYDADGNLIPKDHADLVKIWTQTTHATAYQLLLPTDWIIIRELDNGIPADPAIKSWRETVRLAAGSKVFEIGETTTTPELATYVTSADYSAWPAEPDV